MTTVKLIDALIPGAEYEVDQPDVLKVGYIGVQVPGFGRVLLPEAVVVPVLPTEPPELGWYLATIGEAEQVLRKVEPDGWSVGRNNGFLSSWKTLNEDFPGITLVRLVPEPASARLPWSHTDKFGDCAMVDGVADSDGNVLLKIETASRRSSSVVVPAQQLLGVAWAAAAKVPTDTLVVGA